MTFVKMTFDDDDIRARYEEIAKALDNITDDPLTEICLLMFVLDCNGAHRTKIELFKYLDNIYEQNKKFVHKPNLLM